MAEGAYGESFLDALALEEYKSLRSESAEAKRNQQTIFQWSMAAAGVIVVASVAVTRTASAAASANASGYLAATLSFLLGVPTGVGCAFGAWLGEVERMERVGRYLRTREAIVLAQLGLHIGASEVAKSFAIQWETLISDGGAKRHYGKNRLGSASACILFVFFFIGSLGTSVALAFTSAAKYQLNTEGKVAIVAACFVGLAAFGILLVRRALALSRSTQVFDQVAEDARGSLTQQPPTYDVVLPCLNEEAAVRWVGSRLRLHDRAKVFLINDSSTDQSVAIAKTMGMTVVDSLDPRGIGTVSNLGLLQGSSDIVCIFDCDGTFHPSWVGALIEPIVDGSKDLVIGERDPLGNGWTRTHRIFSVARVVLVRRKFRELPITDFGSARAVRRSVLTSNNISVVATEAWSLDLTLKVLQATDATRIGQVRVPYLPRIGDSKITGKFRGVIKTTIQSLRVMS